MSLPLTRATTFAEADESDPQEAVMSRPASRADKMRAFITERSIVVRNRGHSSTTVPGRSGRRQSGGQRACRSNRDDSGLPFAPHFDAICPTGPCVILCLYFIREIAFMARCEICNKGPIYGNRVSHAHNLTNRRWNPNLQRVRVLGGKTHKYMRVCTRCIRSGRVTKA